MKFVQLCKFDRILSAVFSRLFLFCKYSRQFSKKDSRLFNGAVKFGELNNKHQQEVRFTESPCCVNHLTESHSVNHFGCHLFKSVLLVKNYVQSIESYCYMVASEYIIVGQLIHEYKKKESTVINLQWNFDLVVFQLICICLLPNFHV